MVNDKLGHVLAGEGSHKVSVLHDWMGDIRNWDPVRPYLDKKRFTFAFADLRGYGSSRRLGGPYDLETAAKDIFDLADSLDWPKFSIVAHSMSGMITQWAALQDTLARTGRIQRVVAVTPVPANSYPFTPDVLAFMGSAIGNREVSAQAFAAAVSNRYTASWGEEKTARSFETSDNEALASYLKMWSSVDFSRELDAANVAVPFLVVCGDQDFPGVQIENLQNTFGKWLRSVAFERIATAGHYPMQETPVLLATLINRFLSSEPLAG